MKNLLILFMLIFTAQIVLGQGVKTASYWTCPWLYEGTADSLSRFDLVIIDLENMVNNYDSLVKMKKLNPAIKLVCYSNPMEIFDPRMDKRPLQNEWTSKLYGEYRAWLLKTNKGKKAIFYPGMRMINMSSVCPKINGLTYSEWMADFLVTRVLSDSIWDGYFLDNGGGNISWVYSRKKEQIDANDDGIPDTDSALDSSWSEGIHTFLKKIRDAKGKDFILMANKGSVEFMDILDGRMFEDFPNDYLGSKIDWGWHQCMLNAEQTGPYTIFQVSERNLEFGAASSLLLDNVYLAVGQNNLRFYPEFRYNLGNPNNVTYRHFEKGIIEVNPSKKEGKIYLLQ